jgi:4-hydroxy-4-methyl-2-oxoglutarate aldolase
MGMIDSLPDIRRHLFTAVLSDCLDSVGLRRQALPSRIRPLDEALVMCGRARTATFIESHDVPAGANPYELEIALVDSLQPDDIPVFACANSLEVAPWGELLATAARVRGSAGALMDGCVRDVKAIRAMAYPVFHGGIGPLDTRGRARIVALDVPVLCAGVAVATGDLVFGDADGVVIIPRAAEAEVLRLAFEKVKGEKTTLADLQRGDRLADVFARHGIL